MWRFIGNVILCLGVFETNLLEYECHTCVFNSAAQEMSREHLTAAFRKLADKVNKLRGHCDVMLMNDAVRSLHNEQQENTGKCESVQCLDCAYIFYRDQARQCSKLN